MKLLITALALTALISLSTNAKANRDSDFLVSDHYKVTYQKNDNFVKVEERLEIKAYNNRYYLPINRSQVFTIPNFEFSDNVKEKEFLKNSILVTDRYGNNLEYTLTEENEYIKVSVKTNQEVTTSNPLEYTLQYKTHELIDINGNITNFYIPGIAEETLTSNQNSSNGATFSYDYSADLSIPNSLPKASYLSPDSIDMQVRGDRRIYSMSTEQRRGSNGWIQIGTNQYYYFKMVQKATKTDKLIPKEANRYSDLLSTNVYRLPLPKEDTETNQEVYFSRIDPMPSNIEEDAEGNYVAYFEVPANEDREIIVEGYITLHSEREKKIPVINLDEYKKLITDKASYDKYLEADKYWESNNPQIKELANNLSKDANTINELIEKDYNYVINQFEYSFEKAQGENERIGALQALAGGEKVCMEYADTMIALLRAQGVPARAVVGYGNDPTGAENEIGSEEAKIQNFAHQWLQVWIPEYGWLNVDPTWGETEKRYIGSDLDHMLWYTLAESEQTDLGTGLQSANQVTNNSFDGYDLYIKALDRQEFENETGELQSIGDVIGSIDVSNYDSISYFIKTTPPGKILIVTLPICTVLLGLILGVSLITKVFRK
jgi:transglutaminase-like putative cysteine protease